MLRFCTEIWFLNSHLFWIHTKPAQPVTVTATEHANLPNCNESLRYWTSPFSSYSCIAKLVFHLFTDCVSFSFVFIPSIIWCIAKIDSQFVHKKKTFVITMILYSKTVVVPNRSEPNHICFPFTKYQEKKLVT